MGTNIDVEKLKKWMRKNGWQPLRTNKHEIWIFKIINEKNGETLAFGQITINTHRSKGRGISDDAIKDIANIMKIKKNILINMIREKIDININNYKK